jgi:magnesium chelatase subunit D
MESVKGAVLGMLTDAYQKRDRVALVVFRGARAERLLPPTSSIEQAEYCLSQLPTGGRTPLADGLRLALETVDRAMRADRLRPLIAVITDGRSNVATDGQDPLAEARQIGQRIAALDIAALVVDTEEGRLKLGLAAQLARSMAAPCVRLSELESGAALNALVAHQ